MTWRNIDDSMKFEAHRRVMESIQDMGVLDDRSNDALRTDLLHTGYLKSKTFENGPTDFYVASQIVKAAKHLTPDQSDLFVALLLEGGAAASKPKSSINLFKDAGELSKHVATSFDALKSKITNEKPVHNVSPDSSRTVVSYYVAGSKNSHLKVMMGAKQKGSSSETGDARPYQLTSVYDVVGNEGEKFSPWPIAKQHELSVAIDKIAFSVASAASTRLASPFNLASKTKEGNSRFVHQLVVTMVKTFLTDVALLKIAKDEGVQYRSDVSAIDSSLLAAFRCAIQYSYDYVGDGSEHDPESVYPSLLVNAAYDYFIDNYKLKVTTSRSLRGKHVSPVPPRMVEALSKSGIVIKTLEDYRQTVTVTDRGYMVADWVNQSLKKGKYELIDLDADDRDVIPKASMCGVLFDDEWPESSADKRLSFSYGEDNGALEDHVLNALADHIVLGPEASGIREDTKKILLKHWKPKRVKILISESPEKAKGRKSRADQKSEGTSSPSFDAYDDPYLDPASDPFSDKIRDKFGWIHLDEYAEDIIYDPGTGYVYNFSYLSEIFRASLAYAKDIAQSKGRVGSVRQEMAQAMRRAAEVLQKSGVSYVSETCQYPTLMVDEKRTGAALMGGFIPIIGTTGSRKSLFARSLDRMILTAPDLYTYDLLDRNEPLAKPGAISVPFEPVAEADHILRLIRSSYKMGRMTVISLDSMKYISRITSTVNEKALPSGTSLAAEESYEYLNSACSALGLTMFGVINVSTVDVDKAIDSITGNTHGYVDPKKEIFEYRFNIDPETGFDRAAFSISSRFNAILREDAISKKHKAERTASRLDESRSYSSLSDNSSSDVFKSNSKPFSK